MRKDFPQRVGVALVAIGVVGSSIAWYHADLAWTFGILFATALADVLLYAVVGNALNVLPLRRPVPRGGGPGFARAVQPRNARETPADGGATEIRTH